VLGLPVRVEGKSRPSKIDAQHWSCLLRRPRRTRRPCWRVPRRPAAPSSWWRTRSPP